MQPKKLQAFCYTYIKLDEHTARKIGEMAEKTDT